MPKTKDGLYNVTATEQSGEWSGLRVGRIWVQNLKAKKCSSWRYWGVGSNQTAALLERYAASHTAEQFDNKLVEILSQ